MAETKSAIPGSDPGQAISILAAPGARLARERRYRLRAAAICGAVAVTLLIAALIIAAVFS